MAAASEKRRINIGWLAYGERRNESAGKKYRWRKSENNGSGNGEAENMTKWLEKMKMAWHEKSMKKA
jgi:hypothetical protein